MRALVTGDLDSCSAWRYITRVFLDGRRCPRMVADFFVYKMLASIWLTMRKAPLLVLAVLLSVVLSILSHAEWKQTGPYGGSVHVFEVSGSNVFAGMYGGVFLSTDGGAEWKSVNNGLTDTSYISALAVRGTSPRH